MEKFHRNVLQSCHVDLCQCLDIETVLDPLCQENVVTIDDVQRVRNQSTDKDKRRQLLEILPTKGPDAYRKFKQTLANVKQQRHLYTLLCHKEDEIRKKAEEAAAKYLVPRLQNSYTEEDGETSLEDIKQFVADKMPREVDVTQQFLQQLVCQAFPQCHYIEATSSFEHLVLKNIEEDVGLQASPLPRKMDEWTEVQLCQWLHCLEIRNPNVAQTVVEQKINGLVFHHCTKEEIKDLFESQLKYGEIKTMLIKRDLYLQSSLEQECAGSDSTSEDKDVAAKSPSGENLRAKLVRLLCQGESEIKGDTYPILVINKPAEYMDRAYLARNLSFLGDIKWKAAFDFDSTAAICDFLCDDRECLMNIISSPDRLVCQSGQTEEKLCNGVSSTHTSWVFCNGFKSPSLGPYEWKRGKREGFATSVRSFSEEIPPGRVIVVFCLLSDDWKVMLEGGEELFSAFQDQWMCIIENDAIAKPWMDGLMDRHVSPDRFCLELRVVSGIPWYHVQETIEQIQGLEGSGACQLPMSDGTFCTLSEKRKSDLDLVDLDILGARECDNSEIENDGLKLAEMNSEVEQRFYKGGEVSWLNFWFKTHVCERQQHKQLVKMTRNVLEGRFQNEQPGFVQRLNLYHQPGAGGTTVAKNVLWDLKDEYRCAIVRSISSPGVVSEQIYTLWSYKDTTSPRPVLILVDNQDDEQTNTLQAVLEDKVRRGLRDTGRREITNVVCLFLVCHRRSRLHETEVPTTTACVLLKHELQANEREWFRKKAKELEKNYSQNKGADPKLLISFNILKENFDEDFIHRSVSTLLKDIETEAERSLLQTIAFFNTYDDQFRSLPIAAFDMLMMRLLKRKGHESGKPKPSERARAVRWEMRLGVAMLVLLNETSGAALGAKRDVCITNHLLASEIFKQLQNQNNEKISDVAVHVLESEDLFPGEKLEAEKKLLAITGGILKTRQRNMSGKQDAFSRLIEDIEESEGFDVAQKVLGVGFRVTGDPFVAQQAARVAIMAGDLDSALHFVTMATDKKEDDPYLLDTHGRVHKAKLAALYSSLIGNTRSLSVEEVKSILKLAKAGMESFRREQQVTHKLAPSSEHGHFGEMDVIFLLLDCLRYWGQLKDKSTFRRFLVDTDFVPEQVEAVSDVAGESVAAYMKGLEKRTHCALRHLEGVCLHLLDDAHSENTLHSMLTKARENTRSYFGEPSDIMPVGASPQAQCQQRRRHIVHLGGHSLGAMFDLCLKQTGEQKLCAIRDLALQNAQSEYADAFDREILLSAMFALTLFGEGTHIPSISHESLAQMSRRQVDISDTQEHASLESYLFYAMLNWPGKGQACQVTPTAMSRVLKEWESAFSVKYPHSLVKRRAPKTLFFLTTGTGMDAIRAEVELRGEDGQTRMVAGLERGRFSGILSDDGFSVEIWLGDNPEQQVSVAMPAAFPSRTVSTQSQNVHFSIGFSWAGPKAFDVKISDRVSTEATLPAQSTHLEKQDLVESTHPTEPICTHDAFERHLQELDNQLTQIERLEKRDAQGTRLADEELMVVQKKGSIKHEREELIKQRQHMGTDW